MENFFNYYNQQPHSSSSPPPLQSHHILYKERRRTSTTGPFIKPAGSGGGSTKLSTDPQSVAARERRHRISDRFRILKSLVPGGSKMDTVSMLEEAIHYVKFLKAQIWLHQTTTMLHDQEQSSPLPSSLPHPLHDPMMDSIMPQLPNLANGIFQGGHEMASHDGFNF